MTKFLTVKIFFGLLCLTIIGTSSTSAQAQRKISTAYAATFEGPTLSRSEREKRRLRERAANERRSRREAEERRRAEAKNREYARRKRVADSVNKRRTATVRSRRPAARRSGSTVYERPNRGIQVIAVPVQPN